MKIVQTPARFYPYRGGTEQVVYYLSKELVRTGNSVSVICADEPACGDGVIKGIKVRRLKYPFKVANTNITPGLLSALMQEDFDVLHTHLPHPWSADISALAARRRKKPLFLSYHNDITGNGFNGLIAGAYNLTVLHPLLESACRIFVADPAYLEFSPYLRRFKEKVRVYPFGVDTERFRPVQTPENPVVTVSILTRLDAYHRYKGLEVLFQALAKSKCRDALRLRVGGEGELLGYYRNFARKLGLEKMVEFAGGIDDDKLSDFYNKSDFFVLPSISKKQEGFGLVVLEAMACGKAVIVSDIVGVAKEVQCCSAGIVVKAGDAGGLAQALDILARDPGKRRQQGASARLLTEESFSWQRYTKSILEEYATALKD